MKTNAMTNSRREFIKQGACLAGLAAAGLGAVSCGRSAADARIQSRQWPVVEGADTPKLCLGISRDAGVEAMRRVKQIGVSHVLFGGPQLPWTEAGLREIIARFEAETLGVILISIGRPQESVYGGGGRDREIENVQASIRAAGAVGIPVVEYTWVVDRLVEGYQYQDGRGGSGNTIFDYDRVKNLPPKEAIGVHAEEQLWDRLAYFLEAIIPVAEEAGVRMALHPNDPPAPESHGSAQIVTTFDHWKRVMDLVDSPANGMTCHAGVSTEAGADAAEVVRYLGERDRINHVHYRNVVVEEPVTQYVEVFPDEGETDMFGFMRELIRQGYTRGIYPEHPMALDYDRERAGFEARFPGRGGYTGEVYNVAYARAMLQAALSVE